MKMNKRFLLSVNYFFGFCVLLLVTASSCKKETAPAGHLNLAPQSSWSGSAAASHLDSLVAYKASNHQLMMGYYRSWGDRWSSDKVSDPIMTQMPDSVDILSVFANYTADTSQFWVKLKNNYIPALHAKGTKVIFTGGYASSASSASDTAAINSWARGIMSSISNYNYDGYDFDIESTDSGNTLALEEASFAALSKYLGPASGTGKLLIYDTNQNGNALLANVAGKINYVFLQAYWRNTTTLSSNLSSLTPYVAKSKVLVGVDFEDNSGEAADQMPAYTTWDIQNQTGGVFSYGIDNEWFTGKNATTKAAIKAMNPTGAYLGSAGIISGSTYRIISAINNTSVVEVKGAGTTAGTKIDLYSINSPATGNQQWKITSAGNGYYQLQPVNASSLTLDVVNAGTANGTLTQLWAPNGTLAQKWQIALAPNGYGYSLTPGCATGSRLDVSGGVSTNGTAMQIYSSNGTNSQIFKLVKQ